MSSSNNLIQAFYSWYSQTLRNTKYRWLLVAGTLLYLLSPIDIAPDFIPLVGWIDDGLVATLLVAELSQILLSALNRNPKASSDKDEKATTQTIDVEAASNSES